jgi:ABC-type transport system involved in Fe-S cluster assembly fused permease/ATPase subunit
MAKVYQSECWFTLAIIIIIISHRWVLLIKASSCTHLRQFEKQKKLDQKEQGRKESQ